MTTLVTGATGFVGSHVARQLVGAGHPVRVLVRKSSNLQPLEGLPVERVEGDLRDAASLDRAMKGVRRVFHVAADYRLWARDPGEIYESNVEGTRLLLEAAGRAGVERVVYTSTVATIAVPTHEARCRTKRRARRSTQMIGHYKRSKFLAELEAIKAASAGVPVVIVNPTAPVGPGDWKPTPTGRIIVDFLNGKMPAYVDTGLNFGRRGRCCGGASAGGGKWPDRRAVHPGRAQHDAQANSGCARGDRGTSGAASANAARRGAGGGIRGRVDFAPRGPRAADSGRRREDVAAPDVRRKR